MYCGGATPHGDDAAEAALTASRARLFALREARAKPGRDDKILADWNGLMIAALARAAAVFDAPEFLEAARAAYAFVDKNLRNARGQLVHAWREGRIGAAGMLDDYASMARAALALFEATGQRAYLDDALALTRSAQDLFGDSDGSFFLTARDAADVPGARPRHPHDGATPSGIGLMAEVLVRLFHLTGDAQWRSAAESLMRAFTGAPELLVQSPLLLFAADFLERGIVVVVAGAAENPAAAALAHLALSSPDPATCVLRTRDGADWSEGSPGRHKIPIDGAAAAYVCKGQSCSLPVATAKGIAAAAKPERPGRRRVECARQFRDDERCNFCNALRREAAMEDDLDRIDDAALALLFLTLHDGYRAWKGFDWGVMDRLHEKGFIDDPRNKAKSVVFTEEGLQRSRRIVREHVHPEKLTPAYAADFAASAARKSRSAAMRGEAA